MNKQNEAFLKELKRKVVKRIDAKFRKGVREHGGYLWEKPAFEYMGDEIIDLFCYYVAQEKQNQLNLKPTKKDE
jgi:hypothetical protein